MDVKKFKQITISTLKRWRNYLIPAPVRFDRQALQSREKFKADYRIVANGLTASLDFESCFDIGCAQGLLMGSLLEKGVDVYGIELSEEVREFLPEALQDRVSIGDFSEANGTFDLVCCVEVAEHIEPSRSQELVEKVTRLAEEWVYFTAAPPGQSGHGHINCRPHERWISWFEQRGWFVDEVKTRKLKDEIQTVDYVHWLKNNSIIFKNSDIKN